MRVKPSNLVSLYFAFIYLLVQKADGTCNTNFKRTKHREQVMKALEGFVDGNTQILVCLLQSDGRKLQSTLQAFLSDMLRDAI